jgi:L-threonylcarbamoyladenylate synthase
MDGREDRVAAGRRTASGSAEILRVDPADPDEDVLERAAQLLRDGGIVAYATETFYGLAADATSPSACAALFELKGRPRGKALPCVIASASDLASVARTVSPDAAALSRRFWPGPLTLVVEAGAGLAAASEDGSVAVRVSGLPLARRLCRTFGGPLTATSANRSGSSPPTSPGAVLADLSDRLDLVLDSGATPGGLPSTIVDVRGARPTLVREGRIPFSEVLRALETSKS